MGYQFGLRRRPGRLVAAIYPTMKDREFTTAEAAEVIGRKSTAIGATLGSLAARGVVAHPNGEKRSHYASTSGPTYWRFTPQFKYWYERRVI